MALSDQKLDELIELIDRSFRVERNHDPIYIDIAGNLAQLSGPQHKVVFGRRGSGKSCLLVHFFRHEAKKRGAWAIYLNADHIKTLSYPDVLLRLLISIFEAVNGRWSLHWLLSPRVKRKLKEHISELRTLLDEALEAKTKTGLEQNSGITSELAMSHAGIKPRVVESNSEKMSLEKEFTSRKLDYIERHLSDYRDTLERCLKALHSKWIAIVIDDFYLIHRDVQPNVIDYLHRLARGTGYYLKIGTIRHRTDLRRFEGQVIGVELGQDVSELSLDHTLEDIEATRGFLADILDQLGKDVGIERASTEYISEDGLFQLTLASGGVPRDYLTIFKHAVQAARQGGNNRWITPKYVHKAAARAYYRGKLSSLKEDTGSDSTFLESVFADLLNYTLREKKKTVFLVSQEEAGRQQKEHNAIKQLMDSKLVHIIEPDTSAAASRPGRYEAYALDTSCFMEPRLRRIDIVQFWKFDASKRRIGVREAPSYPLERIKDIWQSGKETSAQDALEETAAELGSEEEETDEDTH